MRQLNRPIATFGKHVAVAGLAFAPENFGRHYEGDLFAAEFGNNADVPYSAGHQVVRIKIGERGLPETGHDDLVGHASSRAEEHLAGWKLTS